MSSVYPGEFRSWITRLDYTHIVFAAHFNSAQDELNSLLATVGLTPQIARNDPGSTPFTLQPIVDWIGNAPDDELDWIIDLIGDEGPESHQYDPEQLLGQIGDRWPHWLSRTF